MGFVGMCVKVTGLARQFRGVGRRRRLMHRQYHEVAPPWGWGQQHGRYRKGAKGQLEWVAALSVDVMMWHQLWGGVAHGTNTTTATSWAVDDRMTVEVHAPPGRYSSRRHDIVW